MFTQEKINVLYALAAVLAQTKDHKTVQETDKKIQEIIKSLDIATGK